jgi:hypothetical protein
MSDDKEKTSAGILKGLAAIDESIIKSGQNGPPGSGLFYLLETLAGQFMGTPRLGYPVDKHKEEPAKEEPTNTDHKSVPPPAKK